MRLDFSPIAFKFEVAFLSVQGGQLGKQVGRVKAHCAATIVLKLVVYLRCHKATQIKNNLVICIKPNMHILAPKYGQVGCPGKDLAKCSSETRCS